MSGRRGLRGHEETIVSGRDGHGEMLVSGKS